MRPMASSTSRMMRLRVAVRCAAGSLAGGGGWARIRARVMLRRTERAMRSKAVVMAMRASGADGAVPGGFGCGLGSGLGVEEAS